MGQDWTDEEIAEALNRLKPYAGFRLIGRVAGVSFKTVYRVADGEDFEPPTRLALITLFEESGLGTDPGPGDAREAARKIHARDPSNGRRPSAEQLAESGQEHLRRAADEEGEEKHG